MNQKSEYFKIFLAGVSLFFIFISFSAQAKIIRYKQPDGTIVMKSVPDDYVPLDHQKTSSYTGSDKSNQTSSASLKDKSAVESTGDIKDTPADSIDASVLTKEAGKVTTSLGISKSGKGNLNDLTEEFIDKSQMKSDIYTYWGVILILGLSLLITCIIIFYMYRHYSRSIKSLKAKIEEQQARNQETAEKYSAGKIAFNEKINNVNIQNRGIIKKFYDLARASSPVQAVVELFHIIAMFDSEARCIFYLKDNENDQIYAWKYFNISPETAQQRTFGISDNCLMNLCMTRKKALSQLDAENDSTIEQTISNGAVKCVMAVPLMDLTIEKGCFCIEQFTDNSILTKDLADIIKAASSIASNTIIYSGMLSFTREQIILGKTASVKEKAVSAIPAESFLYRTVSNKIADQLRKYPDLIKHSSGVRKGTLVYGKIDNFKEVIEQLDPFDLIDYLNDFYESMKEIIFKFDGTIDTTAHGELIAFWGGPITQKYHASMAAQACLRMSSVLKRRNSGAQSNNMPQIKMGISMASGDLTLGRIGPENRCDYSIIGKELQIVKELQVFSEKYNVNIVVTGETQEIIESEIETREIDMVKLFGHQTTLYHITGLKSMKKDS
jgi:class 3 adenylate cyclase